MRKLGSSPISCEDSSIPRAITNGVSDGIGIGSSLIGSEGYVQCQGEAGLNYYCASFVGYSYGSLLQLGQFRAIIKNGLDHFRLETYGALGIPQVILHGPPHVQPVEAAAQHLGIHQGRGRGQGSHEAREFHHSAWRSGRGSEDLYLVNSW